MFNIFLKIKQLKLISYIKKKDGKWSDNFLFRNWVDNDNKQIDKSTLAFQRNFDLGKNIILWSINNCYRVKSSASKKHKHKQTCYGSGYWKQLLDLIYFRRGELCPDQVTLTVEEDLSKSGMQTEMFAKLWLSGRMRNFWEKV